MRRCSEGMAMVVADDPTTRSLLAAIFSDQGCAVEMGENALDLRRRTEISIPDIVFLDLDLRDIDIFAALDVLAGISFAGAVQVIGGRCTDSVNRAIRAGDRRGLRMRRRLTRPLRANVIRQILREEGVQPGAEPNGSTGLAVFRRPWACASASAGLIDLAIRPPDRSVEPPPPLEQLLWWTKRQDLYRKSLLGLPAPATVCIAAQPSDIAVIARVLPATMHHPSHLATTIILGEDDVFADLPQMRERLRMLRTRGASIRLTGCGTRFFAVTGHDPLPVDQAVLGNPLSAADRVMGRLAELAHRAGTLLLADDLGSGLGSAPVLPNSLDLWRDTSLPWQAFAPAGMMPARLPARLGQVGAWQRVALTDALSIRRTTDRSAQS